MGGTERGEKADEERETNSTRRLMKEKESWRIGDIKGKLQWV